MTEREKEKERGNERKGKRKREGGGRWLRGACLGRGSRQCKP